MYNKRTIVINIIGGPGSGKSTQAAILFGQLKIMGYNCELVTEYPKDKVWEESFKIMNNQLYLFAKQHQRMWRIHDKVDIIITDSPLLQFLAYSEHMSNSFKNLIIDEFNQFENINIFINRNKNIYQTIGRTQTYDEAYILDQQIKVIFITNDEELNNINVKDDCYKDIINILNNNDYFKQLKKYNF